MSVKNPPLMKIPMALKAKELTKELTKNWDTSLNVRQKVKENKLNQKGAT